MSAPILVAYATHYGSTAETAQFIASVFEDQNQPALCQPARGVKSLEGVRAVVLGAPLFMFHWHKDALRFLDRFRKVLPALPAAAFALGPTTEPRSEKEWTDARAILDKELATRAWFAPTSVALFGGRWDPGKIGFPFKAFASQMPASDLRDWDAIRAWAQALFLD